MYGGTRSRQALIWPPTEYAGLLHWSTLLHIVYMKTFPIKITLPLAIYIIHSVGLDVTQNLDQYHGSDGGGHEDEYLGTCG